MNATFKNPITSDLKAVKIGWSWTLFLFTQFFGIPLFVRKLNNYGLVAAVLSLLSLMLIDLPSGSFGNVVYYLCLCIIVVLSIYLGIKGNEMTAKNFLRQGWIFSSTESDVTAYAKKTWNIS